MQLFYPLSDFMIEMHCPVCRRRRYVRETECRYWEHVTASCMTEESDDENGEKIVTHQLLWRSECECLVALILALFTIQFLIVHIVHKQR